VACSGRSNGEIISRFLTGQDAPPAVLATRLYQELPSSLDPDAGVLVGEGRKLLVFADSRQDAAFFAPYLEDTYGRAVQRNLIFAAAHRAPAADPMRGADLVPLVVSAATDARVLSPSESFYGRSQEVRRWLRREIISPERRLSLDGSGMAEVRIAWPIGAAAPQPLLDTGMSPTEARDLVLMLLDTLRLGGAVTSPEGTLPDDPMFAPRDRDYGVRLDGPGRAIITWLPAAGSNRRLDIMAKVLQRVGSPVDPRSLLTGLWHWLTDPRSPFRESLVGARDRDATRGVLHRLAFERFEFAVLDPAHLPVRCDRCRQVWWRSVRGVCPTFGCAGTVTPVDQVEIASGHYANLNSSLRPIGMAVEEHTAQWTPAEGSRIQEAFATGKVNVLSCSTTFELGVDLGEIEAVLMRNIPPSPANYIQRAGRAGRRAGVAAFVVAFAQRRNHDLSNFADPLRMIDGVIAPPRIVIDNPTIVRRHVHSVAFAAFQRDVLESAKVGEFFEPADDGGSRDQAFVDWLRTHPADVGTSLRRIVPPVTAASLGIAEWAWVDALLEAPPDDPSLGWLGRAGADVRGELTEIDGAITEAAAASRYPRAGALQKLRETLTRADLLGFLARRNVLPKYGFPVDVVPLDLTRADDAETARKIALDRDLKIAIAEYAPGGEVVAAKRVWVSRGLRTRPDRAWPSYHWAVCGDCGAFRQGLTDLPLDCPICGGTRLASGGRGEYVIPVFGFVGTTSSRPTGDARPARRGSIESFFADYGPSDHPPDVSVITTASGVEVERRLRRQGRIILLNRGPLARGYQMCPSCGFAAPPPQGASAKKSTKGHVNVRRGEGQCSGSLVQRQLGHEFLTDVVEFRLPYETDQATQRSVLYALLEGASVALSVKRDEIDGTLYRHSQNEPPSFVVYDTVAGGAGHAQRIGGAGPAVFEAARKRVEACECGEETSCYSCLRSYGNQLFHDQLSRGKALRVLERLG
jgi:hypothetical protein